MSSKKPIIAINCDFDISQRPVSDEPHYRDRVTLYKNYYLAVLEAGGVPLLVPPSNRQILDSYLSAADGFLLTGGEDYPPDSYGDQPHPKTVVGRPERSQSDLVWVLMTMESKKPLFGICAGLQLVNIAKGGKLIQHLETEIGHSASLSVDEEHPSEVFEDSKLAEIFGAGPLPVNSSHHQAADPEHLGKGLKITARSPDGVIEALELEDAGNRFFVTVQWHPERIKNEEHRKKLFASFVGACEKK